MNLDLYVIISGAAVRGTTPCRIAEQAIAGGAETIQLRDKVMDPRRFLRTARELRAITQRTGTLFIVNDRLDIALACCADGVHLGQGDLEAGTARQLTPAGFIIGVSVGTVEDAVRAEEAGADYIALSPVFPTRSKDDAGPGHGLSRLREIRKAVGLPLIAVGGIGPENVSDVINSGADGVAVISAVVDSPDITAAARDLKGLVLASKKSGGRQIGMRD
jgi:thiamine-phosphate pyrophosphorylase